MITSGINYKIGGSYYWKLYRSGVSKLKEGNDLLFAKIDIGLVVVGIVCQFICFCFVMESKELEYEVDIVESMFIHNEDESRRIAVDESQLMKNSLMNSQVKNEVRNSQLMDYANDNGNDDDEDNESEIKDSYPNEYDE